MKNIFTILSLFITCFSITAQPPTRTSLYEGFTGENCGPCLFTNYTLTPLLVTNSTQIIPIMWEVPITSATSNTWSLYQTNRPEINWRYKSSSGGTLVAGPSTIAYGYPSQNTATNIAINGINTSPTGRIDGQHQWTFGAVSDDPSDLNSTVITSAQTQTTNFRVYMTANWSPTFTNCAVDVTVTSVTSFTAVGALMFRLCLIEREINFATSPGLNGEKNFYDAVRKSYPTTIISGSVTSMGTPLPGTWTAAQTQTFTVNCNIPTYIRDISQMAFVGFVQDDGDRKVYQATRTPQPQIPNDIKLDSLIIPLGCSSTFTPSLLIQNLGTVAVTALTLAPWIDGIAQPSFNYNGLISGNSTSIITLPSYSASHGSHVFSLTIAGVSGGDLNLVNNTKRNAFGINNVVTLGVSEGFATFPPVNWFVLNHDFMPSTWGYASAGGFGTSIGSAKFDLWNNLEFGDSDGLYLPAINLTGFSNPILTFDVAYSQYTNQNDKLDVMVSTNCGASWTNVYSKQGTILSTAPSNSVSAFIPTASQWRTETINLPSLANQPSVFVKFVATTFFGNNLYLDNVNLGQPTSVEKNNLNNFSLELFPNPTSDVTNLTVNLSQNEMTSITIMNTTGQLVYSSQNNLQSGKNTIKINSEYWASGVYIISVQTQKGYNITRLNIIK